MAKLNIYKRGRTWWVDLYVDGRRVRRSTRCRNEAEARHTAQQIVESEMAGAPVPSANGFSLGQAVELRRQHLEKLVADGKRSLATMQNFTTGANAITTGIEPSIPCEAITEQLIVEWLDYERTRRRRHGSRKGELSEGYRVKLAADLRAILRHAWRKEKIDARVHDRIPDHMLQRKRPHVEALTQEERRQVIAAATPAWVSRFLVLANETGARAGEILSLERDNVRFTAEGHAFVLVPHTKTGRPRTLVLSSSAALRALEDQLAEPGETYVFESPRMPGRTYAHGYVNLRVRDAFERAGLYQTGRGVHSFRRSVLSDMIRDGERLEDAAKAMGHTAATAARHYEAAGVVDERAVQALLRYQRRRP